MFVVSTVVTALLWAHCSGLPDNNDQWRRADTLLQQIDTVYTNIARHPYDDKNATLRHASIVSRAIYNFLGKNTTDYAERINEAVTRTRERLNETADVIASPMRTLVVYVQALIQQPMTDVKVSCPPSKMQAACDTDLLHLHEDEEANCVEYHKNVELYKLLSDKQHASQRADFMKLLDLEGVSTDEDALASFQKHAMAPSFKNTLKYLDKLGKMVLYGYFPCKFPLMLFK